MTESNAYRRSWAGYWVALLIVVLGALFVSLHWQEIPERIATHFDFQGNPDTWQNKSVRSVFTPSFISLFVLLPIWLIMFAVRKFPSGNSGFSGESLGSAELRKQKAVLAASISSVGWFIAAIAVTIALVQVVLVLPRYAEWKQLVILSTILVSVVGMFVMMAVLVIVADRAGKPQAGDVVAEGEEERRKNVKWGCSVQIPTIQG